MPRESLIRQWIEAAGAFIAGGVLFGALFSLLFVFLNDNELKTTFLFKMITLAALSGSIFCFLFFDIRADDDKKAQKRNRFFTALFFSFVLLAGFFAFHLFRISQYNICE